MGLFGSSLSSHVSVDFSSSTRQALAELLREIRKLNESLDALADPAKVARELRIRREERDAHLADLGGMEVLTSRLETTCSTCGGALFAEEVSQAAAALCLCPRRS